MTVALAGFLLVILIGWPEAQYVDRFIRLWLALAMGALGLLVTERSLRSSGMIERTLQVVFWSGAAMALTGLLFSFVLVGAFGRGALDAVNDVPGVFRSPSRPI